MTNEDMLTLNQIGRFNVTDRPLTETAESLSNNYESISSIFQLDETWIDLLPKNAKLLIVGGGINRLTERELHTKRPDIRITTVDPTLGIEFKDEEDPWKIISYMDGEYLTYSKRKKITVDDREDSLVSDASTFQQNRINSLNELPGSVAALAPHLPFRDDSFDIVVDAFGPTRYLERKADVNKHLAQLCNMLKKGGIGYVNFVQPSSLELLQSFDNVQIEIIKSQELKLNGEKTSVYTVKISKNN